MWKSDPPHDPGTRNDESDQRDGAEDSARRRVVSAPRKAPLWPVARVRAADPDRCGTSIHGIQDGG